MNSITTKVFQYQMRSLDEPQCTAFNSLSKDLLRSTTPEAFKKAHGTLFLSSNNEKNDLIGWLQWWSDRKNLMFRAFTSTDVPSSNLVVHAGWKNSNEIHLSLLNCAYVDIKTSLLLNQLFEDVQRLRWR